MIARHPAPGRRGYSLIKRKVIFMFFLIKFTNTVFPQTIDFDIMGVYLPVEYIASLERTKHNPASWAFNDEHTSYDLLIVEAYTIKASDRMYDGITNIYLWDMINYHFEYDNAGIFCIDEKNNKYKKISNAVYEFENWQEIVCNYIGKIIMDELIQSGDVILENDLITIPALDNEKFRIQWQAFDSRDRMNLRFESVVDYPHDLFLEIRPNEYIFYGYHYFSTDVVWSKKL
jgi:hypothetical protein